MKTIRQILSQLFRQFVSARGQQVDVLAHARLADVGVHSLGAEDNNVVAAAQKFKDGVMNRRQRKPFAHCKLLKC